MRDKCIGKRTVKLSRPVRIVSSAAIAGAKEGQGPIGSYFDLVLEDDTWGEKSWECAERKMFENAVRRALDKANFAPEGMDLLLGGDLLNQIISANYAARELKIPFLGLYGACSTMAESLLIGSMLIDGGYAGNVVCASASHFSTAERQYRLPLEMGTQPAPTAQRTVTGAGAAFIADCEYSGECQYDGLYITGGVIGRVIDLGITDSANMGAAMAPAAADTLLAHFEDTGKTVCDYDVIVTGDLGSHGSELFRELLKKAGVDIDCRHIDCGNLIFAASQNVHCGGSGCGCCAVTLNAYLLNRMQSGEYSRLLFIATGALMSPTSGMQGESIPGVAHAVVIERKANGY